MFDFLRRRQLITKLGIGLVISFIAVVFAIIIKGDFAVISSAKPYIKIMLGIGGLWAAFAILSLVDIEWKGHLFFSVISFDQATRVLIVDAMTRTGVPPVNPSYHSGFPVRLTFLYYFWYVLCRLINQIGGRVVDARAH